MPKKQTELFERKPKKVNVLTENSEAKMELKVAGKNATEKASKILRAFEKACEDIRENKHLTKENNDE